ncbi:MAG: AraC family transcriptional regulator [Lachnospiraceae bacterium]|nr:AraC family transcriptional regulator [Lachnospiraceae bacterium]
MRELYTDLNIRFTVEQTDFYALNLVFERFLRTIPSHSHGNNSYEIHYIPSGYGHVKINQVLYDIVPGTLYITGPHVEHAQVPSREDPMCEYCVYVKVGKGKKKNPQTPSVLELFTGTPFWFGQDSQNIHGLMKQLFYELENRYTGYMIQVETLLTQLIILMVRNYEMKSKAKQHFAPSNLEDSKFIILEEYFLYEYQNLSLDMLAQRLGLSRRQTERLLKDHYGKTFQQKKTEAKMAAAAILLSDSSRTISSIAEELGYSSGEHFSAAFKRHYQMTAREYRKNI